LSSSLTEFLGAFTLLESSRKYFKKLESEKNNSYEEDFDKIKKSLNSKLSKNKLNRMKNESVTKFKTFNFQK